MTPKIRTIVVEDEYLARDGLLNYIREVDFLEIVTECEDAIDANHVLTSEKVDLMFLDIQMPKLTGIDFLRSVKTPPMVIVTTAYPNFALEGYELDVLDYLLKPFPFDRFLKAANKARELFELKSKHPGPNAVASGSDYCVVKCDHRYEKIQFRDILYIEGMENYIIIWTAAKKYVTLLRMKTIEDALPPSDFIRIHKSYIASIAAMSSIDGNDVIIAGKRLPISREMKGRITGQVIRNGLV